MKEPQYYPADEQIRQQVQKTQDAAWATKVLVYGAVNKFPGWPSVWELLDIVKGEGDRVQSRMKTLAIRLLAEGAGSLVARLPEESKKRLLEVMQEKF